MSPFSYKNTGKVYESGVMEFKAPFNNNAVISCGQFSWLRKPAYLEISADLP